MPDRPSHGQGFESGRSGYCSANKPPEAAESGRKPPSSQGLLPSGADLRLRLDRLKHSRAEVTAQRSPQPSSQQHSLLQAGSSEGEPDLSDSPQTSKQVVNKLLSTVDHIALALHAAKGTDGESLCLAWAKHCMSAGLESLTPPGRLKMATLLLQSLRLLTQMNACRLPAATADCQHLPVFCQFMETYIAALASGQSQKVSGSSGQCTEQKAACETREASLACRAGQEPLQDPVRREQHLQAAAEHERTTSSELSVVDWPSTIAVKEKVSTAEPTVDDNAHDQGKDPTDGARQTADKSASAVEQGFYIAPWMKEMGIEEPVPR